ncbi:UNVERIFIED_CONTAM: hypothetical protein FKN15_020784 [Acipenser sinensis]
MMYSISSEKGFWKVKELVLIQTHSLLLDRNRNITDRTCPFSLVTLAERERARERARDRKKGELLSRKQVPY